MEITCGPLKFSGNFDSGNLGNVELVKCNGDGPSGSDGSVNSSYSNITHYEVNVWTKVDCAGTQFSNGNRTWFYFGVNGGRPNGVLKLNILNLNKQRKLFEQGMQPVFCYIPEKPKWERVKDRVCILDDSVKDHSCGISFHQKLPSDTRTSTLFIAFTYPFSCENMTSWLDDIDSIYCNPSPRCDNQLFSKSDIYYKRETVAISLEGRPVDLLTITSNDGMLSTCYEPYLDNLFPYREQKRCCKFINKKVVFLSSRVHPGEVPAQFVMNGVIKFLLEEKDPRARMLRRLFVFKLMPILNPDGVYRGHYRTDPRGVNLNRVYLQPSPTLHPTIYAARKLLLYAHYGHDSPDDYEIENEISNKELENPDVEDQADNFNQTESDIESRSRLCAGCVLRSENIAAESENVLGQDNIDESLLRNNAENVSGVSQLEQEFYGHQCTFESCDEDSIIDYHELKKSTAGSGFRSPEGFPSSSSASASSLIVPPSPPLKLKILSPLSHRSRQSTTTASIEQDTPLEFNLTNPSPSQFATKSYKKSQTYSVLKSSEVESGLYTYIDFHGHATKRGIFMYGNHFNDVSIQTECMLLPRLMALNSPHFDFSSCNFTERLMTMRDRRDGASREGSGRVAVLKLTGLIRSYTLECNYNTGRLVNHIISRPDSYGFNDPSPTSVHPPKFTPEIFEAVGKSLVESILDLTDLNPWSRLKSTEFRTLDGLRGFLRRRLEHTIEYRKSPPRSSSSIVPGGSKSSLSPQCLSKGSRSRPYSIPSSPSLKKRANSGKISNVHPPSPSSSGGPLIPKKDNQGLAIVLTGPTSVSLKLEAKQSKTVTEKSSSSNTLAKGKTKTKLSKSKSLPSVAPNESGLFPSSSSSDNRSSVTKLQKAPTTTKKKKKIIKRKKKGTKISQRPESR